MKFEELGLIDPLLKAISDKGYTEPSDVQKKSIPFLIDKEDVLAQSQTGTGKTAAFGLPLLNKLELYTGNSVKGLIICPTRELAMQVAQELDDYAKYMPNVKIATVYGGQPINVQIKKIRRGANIVVATPGRLLDHIKRKTIKLNDCDYLVLDEADEMLNMGFVDDIKKVLTHIDSKSQMAFFSATMPKAILDLSETFLKKPKIIKLSQKSLAAGRIDQGYYEVSSRNKTELLMQLLKINDDKQIMVFSNTKRMVDDLHSTLQNNNVTSLSLHGDMEQKQRTVIMERFKKGIASVLVATDVAARGIDVDSMDLVINYDVPQELEYYVHRIGRTGRAGRAGQAITFVKPNEKRDLKIIEKKVQTKLKKLELPTQKELDDGVFLSLKEFVEKPRKGNNKSVQGFIDRVLEEDMNKDDILEAFLKDYYYSHGSRPIKAQPSKPKGKSRNRRDRKKGSLQSFTLPVGKKNRVKVPELLRFLHKNTGMTSRSFGNIKVRQGETVIEVKNNKDMNRVRKGLNGKEYKNRKIRI